MASGYSTISSVPCSSEKNSNPAVTAGDSAVQPGGLRAE
jgi:hypothetical protein